MSITATKAWVVEGTTGIDNLKFNERYPLPQLGDYDVLVKFHAASLNYRDLIIPQVNHTLLASILYLSISNDPSTHNDSLSLLPAYNPKPPQGKYPLPRKDHTVPGSDGAGIVFSTGPKVTRFRPGCKVLTLFNQGHLYGSLDHKSMQTGLGGTIDGTLRQHGVFPESGLVSMPTSLTYLEGSTLSCAALTAWNGLYGLKPLMAGQVVLTQGTGGVSIFAVQFAKAAGATVIATTSSERKADVLKKLGADHVINYKNIKDWGVTAKALTPGGEGVDHILEVGGPATLAQSLKAIRIDGVISIIGFLSGAGEQSPSFLEVLSQPCVVRGIIVGSRAQFEEMVRIVTSP